MRIILNNASMQPIYEQIVEQIKLQVVDGSLVEETPLPSVRNLSKDLKISALTVKKAYDVLEEDGYVVTIHGKGSYIARISVGMLKEERHREIELHMESVLREAKNAGMQSEEIKKMFLLLLEE
ncbi:MAG TPA: GntR family transcriptional regulator [Lachnospiraceae bacterium]|nr:GntR family transcriptional regulator [Lachnospiraceae bacterium]